MPLPSVDDVCPNPAHDRAAASVFVALISLTNILARLLEHIYSISREFSQSGSSEELEQVLRDWEESLSDETRHIVLRGTHLNIPGAANFRLAYLSVKLLLRRIQLKMSKQSLSIDDATSPFYMHAQRAAEEIAYLVQELDEAQIRGFWIPAHAFSLTSATMFLLRSGLRTSGRNTPLKIARDMVNTLQAHRRNFDWDLADDCVAQCCEILDQIGVTETEDAAAPEFPGFPEFSGTFDIDQSMLEELFGNPAFSDGLDFW